MTFSLAAIQEAHSKFTGVDFPKLIKEFQRMGMVKNSFNLQNGVVAYEHQEGEQIIVQSAAVDVPIPAVSSSTTALDVLKRHQAGETDFLTFCREIAGAGVYKWVSDMEKMTCSYYNLHNDAVVVENIPSVTE